MDPGYDTRDFLRPAGPADWPQRGDCVRVSGDRAQGTAPQVPEQCGPVAAEMADIAGLGYRLF